MISQRFSRFMAAALIAVSAAGMLVVSFDAEARRFGGGKSFGRQSSNVMQQRQAVTPPAAAATPRAAAPAAGAAASRAGAAAPKTGMSRFLGPLAGIAAGLGIAALLSSMGLGGALLEFLSSAILIGAVIFAVMFLVRRFRAGSARPATQAAGNTGSGNNHLRQVNPASSSQPEWPASASQSGAAAPAAVMAAPAADPVDQSWFIPADFDTPSFLANAKTSFTEIQALWDKGDPAALREYLTDDLLKEATPQILEREGENVTEVVLLNAELLGIEKVAEGYLASVRYSGMLREGKDAEAFRFEEVWNLYKQDNAGWLVAGIQQMPVSDE
ncbi:Tim44-like domain-containing protein [Paenalcaligenes niemegkensis]|uniref:Tim44 domain-containing protein n=1 Tax=Paenalcaligenes niemegkensis TaxID=2895469 RepID=UPI001EE98FC7|nr:Tim44-like domain-containing protein [Paenalcaligenes niemegkensis]MCQ9615544.1 Tim44-like domain-containing protein [Paenalcaligenes niemegkensis]